METLGSRICVCGGGSLAHAVAAVLGANPEFDVRVMTRRPDRWNTNIRLLYRDELELTGALSAVSEDPQIVVRDADIVILCVPSIARPEVLKKIRTYVKPGAWVGAFPGFVGFDWVARRILGDQCRLFGAQRVPYVCQKLHYGRTVLVTGIRPKLFLAALPCGDVQHISTFIEQALNMPVVPMQNYLCVNLSLSNPTFNTARLYALYKDWRPGRIYAHRVEFYRDWNERSSHMFIQLDAEIQRLCSALPLDLSYVKPIVQHYEIAQSDDLTRKIRSISALHGRAEPLIPAAGGFELNLAASYFTEDVLYGLIPIRAIAELAGVETPMMDEIIRWYQNIVHHRYLSNGSLCNSETAELCVPWTYGIESAEDLVRAARA